MNRKRNLTALAALAALALITLPVFAHHGAAGFDMSKAVSMKGVITSFEWTNPHNEIHFDVTDEKGIVSHWVAETEPPAVMLEHGWTRKSIVPGDQVTVWCFVAKNGAKAGILQKLVLADGSELTARGGPAAASAPESK